MDSASLDHPQRRLRLEFNQLAVKISRNLGDKHSFQLLKTLWAGVVPKQKLDSATDISQFVVTLLEGDHLSLTNIEPLKTQFETLELGHLTQLCSEYENRAAALRGAASLNGLRSDGVHDFQRLNIGDTPNDISARAPVPESGRCVRDTQRVNQPEEVDEDHFELGSAQTAPLTHSRPPQRVLGNENRPQEERGPPPVLNLPTGCPAKFSWSPQGPKLNPRVFVKDLPFSIWHRFTVALSVERQDGHDWRWLADKLGIPATYRDLWRQNYSNPAEQVLDSWKNKIGEATVGTLFNHMISMEREDLANIL